MMETGVVNRAFELARSGIFEFDKLRRALKKEGFTESVIEQHLGGAGIRKELRQAHKAAQAQVTETSLTS